MEKEEKLDEILRKRNDKVKSKILDIYKTTKSFLNKEVKKDEGRINILNNGKAQYSLVVEKSTYRFDDKTPYKFKLIYSNFDQPRLQIDVVYNCKKLFGEDEKSYNVFDVIEQSKNNLHVNMYLSGEDGQDYINGWEESLRKLIKEKLNPKKRLSGDIYVSFDVNAPGYPQHP